MTLRKCNHALLFNESDFHSLGLTSSGCKSDRVSCRCSFVISHQIINRFVAMDIEVSPVLVVSELINKWVDFFEVHGNRFYS